MRSVSPRVTVLRVTNDEVRHNLDGVCETIFSALNRPIFSSACAKTTPPDNPGAPKP